MLKALLGGICWDSGPLGCAKALEPGPWDPGGLLAMDKGEGTAWTSPIRRSRSMATVSKARRIIGNSSSTALKWSTLSE